MTHGLNWSSAKHRDSESQAGPCAAVLLCGWLVTQQQLQMACLCGIVRFSGLGNQIPEERKCTAEQYPYGWSISQHRLRF
jgi:hypothetical protein